MLFKYNRSTWWRTYRPTFFCHILETTSWKH